MPRTFRASYNQTAFSSRTLNSFDKQLFRGRKVGSFPRANSRRISPKSRPVRQTLARQLLFRTEQTHLITPETYSVWKKLTCLTAPCSLSPRIVNPSDAHSELPADTRLYPWCIGIGKHCAKTLCCLITSLDTDKFIVSTIIIILMRAAMVSFSHTLFCSDINLCLILIHYGMKTHL